MNIKKMLLLAVLLPGFQGAGYASTSWNVPSCYECSCNPLYEGSWNIQFQTGIAPISWRHRGELDLVSCQSSSSNPLFSLANEFPKFNRLYKMPWIVGAKLGYAYTDNAEVYGEFNYLHAQPKSSAAARTFAILNTGQSLVFAFQKYHLVDAYIGARFYFDRWCDRYAFFVGAQIGFTTHFATKAPLTMNGRSIMVVPATGSPSCPLPGASTGTNFFERNTVVSGGFNWGFDVCLCGNWSLVLISEILASCGPRVNTASLFAQPLPAPTLATNLILSGMGTELRFPLTVGIKYTF